MIKETTPKINFTELVIKDSNQKRGPKLLYISTKRKKCPRKVIMGGGHSLKGDICQCDQKRDVTLLPRNHCDAAASYFKKNKKIIENLNLK